MINFDELKIFNKYNRHYLADFFGYKNYYAISRGVVKPSKQPVIILFVTFIKQKSEVQYNDWIDGEFLHWEGENKHVSDKRIINARENNEKIYLFYRNKHHTDFTFYGEIFLWGCLEETKKPSNFIYRVPALSESDVEQNDAEKHKFQYEKIKEIDSKVRTRVGKGKFRIEVFDKWGGSCSVTNVSNQNLLSFAYIKPWSHCSRAERKDSNNGLLLLPTLHYLLKRGLITFNDKGEIVISNQLVATDQAILNITPEMSLRKINSKVQNYLNYHRNNIFLC